MPAVLHFQVLVLPGKVGGVEGQKTEQSLWDANHIFHSYSPDLFPKSAEVSSQSGLFV